jgi:hypothetical protein
MEPPPKRAKTGVQAAAAAATSGGAGDEARLSVLQAVAEDGDRLGEEASAPFRRDREVVRAAVRQNGMALAYASAPLRADKGIVLRAVRQKGEALRHASYMLRFDPDVVYAAVENDGTALVYAAAPLRRDYDVVETAVRNNGRALYGASDRLKRRRSLVELALETWHEALDHSRARRSRRLRALSAAAHRRHEELEGDEEGDEARLDTYFEETLTDLRHGTWEPDDAEDDQDDGEESDEVDSFVDEDTEDSSDDSDEDDIAATYGCNECGGPDGFMEGPEGDVGGVDENGFGHDDHDGHIWQSYESGAPPQEFPPWELRGANVPGSAAAEWIRLRRLTNRRTKHVVECRESAERQLKQLMESKQNVPQPACMQKTFNDSHFLASYNRCGVPRHRRGAWRTPILAVASCLPLEFDMDQWYGGLQGSALTTAYEWSAEATGAAGQLVVAGAACVILWTGTPMNRLVQQIVLSDSEELMDRIMPFIRCMNNFLLEEALSEPTTVYRSSRMTDEQFKLLSEKNLSGGLKCRVGMYTATSKTRSRAEALVGWQQGEMGEDAALAAKSEWSYFWVFKIPAGCKQAAHIRDISRHESEDEVVLVPYTAIKLNEIQLSQDPTNKIATIYADVLVDSYLEPLDLPTIVA